MSGSTSVIRVSLGSARHLNKFRQLLNLSHFLRLSASESVHTVRLDREGVS